MVVASLAAGNGAKKQAQEAGLLVVHHMEWAEIVIGFCLAWAIDIALLSSSPLTTSCTHPLVLSSHLTLFCFHCR